MSFKGWEILFPLDSPKWPVKTPHWEDTSYPRWTRLTQRWMSSCTMCTLFLHSWHQHLDHSIFCFCFQGTPISSMLSSVLFDKNEWETPDVFNPQHFLDSEGQFRRRDAFLPFSAGVFFYKLIRFLSSLHEFFTNMCNMWARNLIKLLFPPAGKRVCLGEHLARMELFLFFTTLLQRFTFSPAPGEMPSMEGMLGFTHSPQLFRMVAVPRWFFLIHLFSSQPDKASARSINDFLYSHGVIYLHNLHMKTGYLTERQTWKHLYAKATRVGNIEEKVQVRFWKHPTKKKSPMLAFSI